MALQQRTKRGMIKSRSQTIAPESPKVTAAFARHETFHPRFGWLKKGYDLALSDTKIFLREDAPVLLGVGKNMVRSIRYWCCAFKVLTEQEGQLVPTPLGQHLLGERGWDPFLENPASLWFLHWNLLKAPCLATAWAYTFNEFPLGEFTPEQLIEALRDYATGLSGKIADSSLRKDVSCLLRMYVDQESKRGLTEESIDCPFTSLRLIYGAGDGRRYEFQIGPKDTLPAALVVAACLEFAGIAKNESSAMGISRLAHLVGSPGRVFKLSEAAIAEAIEQIARRREDLFISDSAGLLQLQYEGNPWTLAEIILDEYFCA